MTLTKNNYGKLLQLCDYLRCPCSVFHENGIQNFDNVQDLINCILDDTIDDIILDFSSHYIDFIGIQHSIFDDEDSLVCVYMV